MSEAKETMIRDAIAVIAANGLDRVDFIKVIDGYKVEVTVTKFEVDE